VSEEGVECDPDTIVDDRDWPEQKSKTELKIYLGFCGYFIKFILNSFSYTVIMLPST
jgi:hypothetical protein